MTYEVSFFISLAFTITVETVVLALAAKKFFKLNHQRLSTEKLVFYGFFCSFSTLPYLWFILPVYISSFYLYAIISELTAVAIESLIIYEIINIRFTKSLILSFLCNAASFLPVLVVSFLSI